MPLDADAPPSESVVGPHSRPCCVAPLPPPTRAVNATVWHAAHPDGQALHAAGVGCNQLHALPAACQKGLPDQPGGRLSHTASVSHDLRDDDAAMISLSHDLAQPDGLTRHARVQVWQTRCAPRPPRWWTPPASCTTAWPARHKVSGGDCGAAQACYLPVHHHLGHLSSSGRAVLRRMR